LPGMRNNDPIKKKSKKLSWLLRHGAYEAGLDMDEAGWAKIDDVLRQTHLSREELDVVVRENDKSRLQLKGDLIRACQGHSQEGVPVTLDALELSWDRWEGEGPLFHGTWLDALPGISEGGILPFARTHVHLTDALDSVVGKRGGVDVMIEIAPARVLAAGIGIFRSPNGVILVRKVPRESLIRVLPMTARATRANPQLGA
jgi:putative RNA 2'-phosphotransferase